MTLLPPRPVRYALAWAGAAIVAVAVGLLAVSLLGGGVRPSLAAGATTSPTPSGSTVSTAETSTQRYVSAGGEVYGSCPTPGARPGVSGVAATGWEIGTSDGGATVTFEKGDQELTIVVSCNGSGVPVFTPTTDDGGGSGSGSGSGGSGGSRSATTTSSPTAGDDRGGSGRSSASASASSTGGSGGGSGSGSGGGSGSPAASGSGGGSGGSGGGGGGGSDDSGSGSDG